MEKKLRICSLREKSDNKTKEMPLTTGIRNETSGTPQKLAVLAEVVDNQWKIIDIFSEAAVLTCPPSKLTQ